MRERPRLLTAKQSNYSLLHDSFDCPAVDGSLFSPIKISEGPEPASNPHKVRVDALSITP